MADDWADRHSPGPVQDQVARCVAVTMMEAQGFSREEMAETLRALSLWPGTEGTRHLLGGQKISKTMTESSCVPTDKTQTFIP